mgnify:CR=1 FL=1
MQIEVLSPALAYSYESFLLRRPETLLYQSWRYQCLLTELLGCSQKTLLALGSNKQVLAALPLMALDGAFGTVFNSLPFYGSNGGLIGEDLAARNAVVAAYNDMVRQPETPAATVIESPLSSGGSEGLVYQLVDERIGQLTPLPQLEDPAVPLMQSFHYKTRNMVRKAEKLGVQVSVDNLAMPFLASAHEENMQEIGGMAKSRRFFDAIPVHFRPCEDYRIFLATMDNQAVAAILLFYFNQTVEYFTPVVRKEFRETQALSAAIFKAMIDAASRGYRWWNWGGTWLSQDGVYRFKSRWGTRDMRYRYLTSVGNRAILEASRYTLQNGYPNFFVVPYSALSDR